MFDTSYRTASIHCSPPLEVLVVDVEVVDRAAGGVRVTWVPACPVDADTDRCVYVDAIHRIVRVSQLYRTCIGKTMYAYRIIWYMNDTSMVPSRYVHDTFNRYTNDTWWDVATTCVSCSGKIHIRYRSDTETIQKRIHSFRYVYDTGQEMHDT